MNDSSSMADLVSAFADLLTFFATVGALVVAHNQLRGIRREAKRNNFLMLLELEAELNNRKVRVDDAAAALLLICDPDNLPKPRQLAAATNQLNSSIENWLNAADRLAFCILKGYLKEKDYISEYKPYYAKLVTGHTEYFRPESVYDNIILLCGKWGIKIPPLPTHSQ